MRFAPVPVAEAAGAILAHSLETPAGRLRKGVVLSAEDALRLAAAGLAEVVVARPDPGDVPEDEAAARLAAALVPDPVAAGLRLAPPFTGRVNLNATAPGIVEVDAAAVHALNRIHWSVTLATLPPWQRVARGTLVATVKIIAYAVPGAVLAAACAAGAGALRVRPVVRRTAGLVITRVAGQDEAAARKGEEAVEGRLAALGIALGRVAVVPHAIAPVAAAVAGCAAELVLILTGSATSDLADVAPAAVVAAGGRIERFGMPVDPGNLLFLAEQAGRPVIGLPGCARSPALNGADWVLERVACGLAVTGDDIAAMGVGGLLKEIPTRPQPRERRR
jgi:molybdenum cofactor cytidylyltransferase